MMAAIEEPALIELHEFLQFLVVLAFSFPVIVIDELLKMVGRSMQRTELPPEAMRLDAQHFKQE